MQRRKEEKERDNRYAGVMRSLVWRYVSAMHRREEESPVTEDDVNEVKMEISSMRYEILDIFEKNGMDISGAEKKEKTVLAKKMKVWERRLMKDFHVAGGAPEEEAEGEEGEEEPANLTGLARFKRAAQKVATNTATSKWGQVISDVGVITNSQIGRCRNRQSFKNQQNLQRAMEEARRIVLRSPIDRSGGVSPIDGGDDTNDTLMQLLKNISEEMHEISPAQTLCVDRKKIKGHSRSTTPVTSKMLEDIIGKKSPIPTHAKPKVAEEQKSETTHLSKENLCKSPAPEEVPPSNRSKTPKPAGITSPPPIIQVTEHEPLKEVSKENPVAEKTNTLPKKRTAPTPDPKVVSRPVAPKTPANQGMIPPPPSRKEEQVTEKPPPSPGHMTSVSVVKPPPVDSIIMIPKCESPLPTIVSISTKDDEMTITMETGVGSGSSSGSLEKLVPSSSPPSQRATPSPSCLRPIRRIEDVTTIKRQPKTGWL